MDDLKDYISDENGKMNIDATLKELDKTIARVSKKLESQTVSVSAVKESIISAAIKKKILTAAIAMAIAATSFLCCTFAYFTDTVQSFNNKIATGSADFSFVDLTRPSGSPSDIPTVEIGMLDIFPGQTVKRNVYAVNKSNVNLYLRARIESTVTLDEKYVGREDEIDMSHFIYDIDQTKWTRVGDYYYYVDYVASGETTPNFISGITFSEEMGNAYKDSKISIKVYFDVVQANGNGSDVFDATGWPVVLNGGEP